MTANPPGAPTAAPGQAEAARLAYFEVRGAAHLIDPWDEITELDARSWEAAAQAAIATATVSALRACAENALSEADMTELRDRLAEVVLTPKPALLRPASEVGTAWRLLDEARAELGRLRSLVAEILDTLNTGSLEGLRPARIHPQQLAEWGKRAAIETPASASPDAAAGQDGTPHQHPGRT